jgi:hypothetical protein
MDPFTVALAVFGVQKLRGKSTGRSFRDALLAAGGVQLAGMGGVGQGLGSFAPQAFGSTSLPGMTGSFIDGGGSFLAQLGNTYAGEGIKSLLGTKGTPGTAAIPEQTYREAIIDKTTGQVLQPERLYQPAVAAVPAVPATGFQSLSPGEKFLATTVAAPVVASAFAEEPEPTKSLYSKEDYEKEYATESEKLKGLGTITQPSYRATSPYNYGQNSMYTFNQGGIVDALPKFAVGGINYMPSKISHDENDENNYVRASGYVEDGSGTGDKDTDTILAQLADGEFVSRSDAVLGAGIMAGASPNNMREMRKLGAAYFYDQQDKFKRIFDLLDASRKTN